MPSPTLEYHYRQKAYWKIVVPELSSRRRLGARPYSCSSVVEELLRGRPDWNSEIMSAESVAAAAGRR